MSIESEDEVNVMKNRITALVRLLINVCHSAHVRYGGPAEKFGKPNWLKVSMTL